MCDGDREINVTRRCVVYGKTKPKRGHNHYAKYQRCRDELGIGGGLIGLRQLGGDAEVFQRLIDDVAHDGAGNGAAEVGLGLVRIIDDAQRHDARVVERRARDEARS